jgi:excisionase family DNA binding protein
MLGLGRTKVYDLIKREHLPVQKFGRATRVPVKHFQQWLQERPQGIA